MDIDHCGQGIATRAVGALMAHAFEGYGLTRVELRIATHNHASRRLAERLAMMPMGTVGNAENLHSGWVDHAIYALTQREWREAEQTHRTHNNGVKNQGAVI